MRLILSCSFALAALLATAGGEARPDLVAKVRAGTLREAKASWWGFDPTDATAPLQAAINSRVSVLHVDSVGGKPWIVTPLRGVSNQRLVVDANVEIRAKKGAFLGRNDCLLSYVNATNVTLVGQKGAALRMNRWDYHAAPYRKGEWRHALSLLGCTNVRVEGLTFAESGGDGIYISTSREIPVCRRVTIRDCICEKNYRQGISVISADGLLIERTIMRDTAGTAPEAGIDFEPNKPWEMLRNCVMRDCVSENNRGDALEIYIGQFNRDTKPISIKVERTRLTGGRNSFFLGSGSGARTNGYVRGEVVLADCTLEKANRSAISISDNPAESVKATFRDCLVRESCVKAPTLPDVMLATRSGALSLTQGLTFRNVRICQPKPRDWVTRVNCTWRRAGIDLFEGDVTIETPSGSRTEHLNAAWRRRWFGEADPTLAPYVAPRYTGLKVEDAHPGKSVALAPFRVRGTARYAFSAAQAGCVTLSGVRWNYGGDPKTGPWKVREALSGREVAQGVMPGTRAGEIAFDVPKAGFYIFEPGLAGRHAFVLKTASVPIALEVPKTGLPLMAGGATGTLVVSGRRDIFAFVQGSDGAEFCSATLTDPTGKVAWHEAQVEASAGWKSQGLPMAGLWRIATGRPAHGCFEDHSISLGGIAPWIFLAEGRLWRADEEAAPRIAILDLGLGAGKTPFGQASDPAVFERALASLGGVTRLSGEDVPKKGVLSRNAFDLLVVPTGAAWPSKAAPNLIAFLRAGGSLLTCGGYAFDNPVRLEGGAWQNDVPPPVEVSSPAVLPLPPASASWYKSAPTGGSVEAADVKGGIAVSSKAFHLWATAGASLDKNGLKGCSALSFKARATGPVTQATLELDERDGSRWLWHFPVSAEERTYAVSCVDFTHWPDSRAKGRGGAGDRVNFDKVVRLSIGCGPNEAPERAAFTLTTTAFLKGVDRGLAQRLVARPQINTRTAHIRDAIHPLPTQVNAFDPSFELRHVARLATASEMKGILPDVALDGAFTGLAAIAQLGVNGHGYSENRCVWRPFIEATDANGRDRGPAAAFVHHHSGTFAGSSWAIFGVDNADLFTADSPVVTRLLPDLVRRLVRRLALNETTTEYACSRAGETARLMTRIGNFGREAVSGKVRFTLADERGQRLATLETPFTAKAGANTPVEAAWPVRADAPDYIAFTAELVLADGSIYDREEGAFAVWNEKTIAAGPRLGRKGTLLTIDGKAAFAMGAQTYWGQTRPTVARSPRSFNRDFAQMRAAGLRWTRLFLPWTCEADKRISDACVLLAQKHGLVIYHTQQNISCMAEGDDLARENAHFAEIAERYRNVPGFAIDIRNEPTMSIRPSWESARRMRRWLDTNREAAHTKRPDALVSVGWSQGWAGNKSSKDPAWCSLGLDFTDRHYYGPPARMFRDLKDLDMRALGKPIILAECGAKCHPTFVKEDPWHMGDTDEQYDARFRSLVTHAFALGASALLSWHWRDPMEGLFPCGLVHATGVPRPTAALFSRMARVYGALPLKENPPDVVVRLVEAPRMSSNETERVRALQNAYAVDAALLHWGANWSKITESALANCRAKVVLDPETLPTDDPVALREKVGALLKEAGCFVTRRPADPETLETFRVPGEGADGWVFWNGGNTPLTFERFGRKITLEPCHAAYLQIAASGRIETCETF